MDIQGQESNQKIQNRSSSLDKYRQSVKSRKSNQSILSIGGSHYHQYPQNQNQKMSLQSNISAKAQIRFNNKDLFQNLASQQINQGSLKNKQRENGSMFEGISQKMSIQPQIYPQVASISCKCPKSKCLLMYCECFSKDKKCNEKCSCYQCRNNDDFNDKRQKARKAVLQKDPTAFMNKLQLVGQQSQLGLKKGCNCKKTKCSKKYCQCFFTGVVCSYLCNCESCENKGPNIFKS